MALGGTPRVVLFRTQLLSGEFCHAHPESLGDVCCQAIELLPDIEILAQLREFGSGVVVHVLDDLGEALHHFAVSLILPLLVVFEAVVELIAEFFAGERSLGHTGETTTLLGCSLTNLAGVALQESYGRKKGREAFAALSALLHAQIRGVAAIECQLALEESEGRSPWAWLDVSRLIHGR